MSSFQGGKICGSSVSGEADNRSEGVQWRFQNDVDGERERSKWCWEWIKGHYPVSITLGRLEGQKCPHLSLGTRQIEGHCKAFLMLS